jgi:iron complex transport system permease protein
VLPAAALLAATSLIGGQFILERMFGFNTSLSIVIEFFGGVTFMILVTRTAR